MALPPAFLEELRARTPLPALIGRKVKLLRSGRQWKGCCPFHGEKSPSFHVYDDHFHCFGCGAHGDAISFAMQSTGAPFMDAVEQLAAEAGLDVPKPSPDAARREQEQLDLHQVLDAAQAAFVRRLHQPDGRAGLDYLRGRGLSEAAIAEFGLGWSGDGRGGLLADLAAQGIPPARLAEAGLTRNPDGGGPARELFFNRVTFPIRDRRGRLISFGGRALGDGKPKYLNGPETAVFHKRRTLFLLDRARAATRAGAVPIVVEGYMDAIALHGAGQAGAVAPLGTALTTEQLEELWRLAPAPVLCFDGDAAGRRAALRAMDLALPLLRPDRTLRVALLPEDEDPDSLIRRNGASGFAPVLNGAKPLIDALFDALCDGQPSGTPEARAALLTRLTDAAARIGDRALAGEYRSELRNRFYARRTGRKPGGPNRTGPGLGGRTRPDAAATALIRLRLLTAILLQHPGLICDVEEAFCRLTLPPDLDRLRAAMVTWDHAQSGRCGTEAALLDSASLIDHLRGVGLEAETVAVLAAVARSLPECGRDGAMPAEAEAGWWHFYELMQPGGLDAEIKSAELALARHGDDTLQARVVALCTARAALRRGEHGLGEQ